MTSKYDITRHIDYENHMRDYIKKSEAMQIIDNLKAQVLNMPIQSHPDYKSLLSMIAGRHAREMSNLEKEMRTKTQITDIKQHPDYPQLVKYFNNRIDQAVAAASKPRDLPSCPPCPTCPNCPVSEPCSQTQTPLPPQQNNTFTVFTRQMNYEPTAANNYPPTEIPAGAVADWTDLFVNRLW